MQASPYRPSPATSGPRRTLAYWPGVGAAPILVAIALAASVAYLTRREDRFPSSVICTNSTQPVVGQTNCVAHDARTLGTYTNVPCKDTPAALEAFLGSSNPLHRPRISATRIGPETKAMVAASVALGDVTDIDAETGRGLLRECVAAPPSPYPTHTVQVLVLDRDYTWSVLAAALVLAIAAIAAVRRRVTAVFDPSTRQLAVVEKGLFELPHTVTVPASEIDDVVVSSGPAGALAGWRVELVTRGGTRAPLSRTYVALTRATHEGFVRRLKALLEESRA
jgi:hypothetical protein